ncbi:hypothetical protein MRX96_055681 [Rhipicephalus microplus]
MALLDSDLVSKMKDHTWAFRPFRMHGDRHQPFVSAALLHPPQPLSHHMTRPNLPPQHFPPALDHFVVAGQSEGFEVPVQGARSSDFSGPQPPLGSDTFRQPQLLESWRSPPATRPPQNPVQHSGPAYQGGSLPRVAGGPPHMAHHPQGASILEQQQQRQFHQPPSPQSSAGGSPFPPMQGGGPPRYTGSVSTTTSFGAPPRFQQPPPPPREPFGKRPSPALPATAPPKTPRLEAPRMPRKQSQGPPARTVNNANIKEVPILDYLPPPEPEKATLPPAIEEDAATQELRRKIEEQKKLREQVMRIKEERRKLAVMQRQKDLLEQRLQATAQPPVASTAPSALSTPAEKPQAVASTSASVKQRLGIKPPAPAPAQQAESAPVLKKVVIVRRTGQQQPQTQQQSPVATTVPPTPSTANQVNTEMGPPRGMGSLRGRGGATIASRIGPLRTAGLAATGTPGAPRKVIRIVSNNGRLQAVNAAGAAGIMPPRLMAPGVPTVRPQASSIRLLLGLCTVLITYRSRPLSMTFVILL